MMILQSPPPQMQLTQRKEGHKPIHAISLDHQDGSHWMRSCVGCRGSNLLWITQ
ncbi:hypothetical protein JD844_001987 [Phrynosoma platyrhinos]|uniref:Uncharacterized protein n=1 Tax=Phrynosoma platyrhinos TaxID=52577 RepID=A0ABQ7TAM4_PHRPL|nr:hypothetical protein JD844_001987 [Phrynosoma platyrhinos]